MNKLYRPSGKKACVTPSSAAVVLNDNIQRPEPVSLVDFLPAFIRTTAVRNSHLENPTSALGDLCNYFRLETERVLLDRNRLNDVPAKDFVTCLDISEIQVGKHIGEQGQYLVTDHVPEINNATRSSPMEREPMTTSALRESNGSRSCGDSFGSYSRSASCIMTKSPVAC
jgi:hypothetical protein